MLQFGEMRDEIVQLFFHINQVAIIDDEKSPYVLKQMSKIIVKYELNIYNDWVIQIHLLIIMTPD